MAPPGTERLHIVLRGAVQEIGFRPTIYRIAQKLRLAGWVRDTVAGIEMEVQGDSQQITSFLYRLKSDQPRAAVVVEEEIVRIAPQAGTWFEILPSEPRKAAPTPAAL